MNKSEIIEFLQYNEKECRVQMPNEIFDDIGKMEFKTIERKAFLYSYYYLLLWLYRYAKYGSIKITVKDIKEILGYSRKYDVLDYIIKKDGMLDQLGYTESTTDFPVTWEFENGLEFTYFSDMDKDTRKIVSRGSNYKIKVPVKGLHRTQESRIEGIEDGVFYEIENTHRIDFDVFAECIEKVGCKGFYVYGYLKYNCDKFTNYRISLILLAREIGVHKDVLCDIVKSLVNIGLVHCYYNGYTVYDSKDNKYAKSANTYTILR